MIWRFALLSLFSCVFLPVPAQDPARFGGEIAVYGRDTADYSMRKGLVLFTGSSTIRMWETLQADFPDRPVLNRGFGGSHMSDLLHYSDEVILRYQPSTIFIYEGDNDIAEGKTPQEVLAAADSLVRKIRRHLPDAIICFIEVKVSPARLSFFRQIQEFNSLLDGLARHYRQQVFRLSIYDLIIGPDERPDESLFAGDGLHLNEKGYRLLAGAVKEFLNELNKDEPRTFESTYYAKRPGVRIP